MEKHALQHIAFHVVLVLVFISNCSTVPLRARRQAQDLVQLHGVIPLSDYDDGDYTVDDLADDTSNLSPLDESGSDNPRQYQDDHGFHSNSTGSIAYDDLAHGSGPDGLVPDLDIIQSDGSERDNGEANQHVDHAIRGVGNVDALPPDTGLLDNEHLGFRGQDHITSSRQSAIIPTSESHGHMDLPATTSTANNSNRLVLNSINDVDRAINQVNVSTHQESETGTGFLMAASMENIENEQDNLNANHLTTRSTTLQQTTTPERFITVKVLNISSQDQTESLSREHVPNPEVIIRQHNGANPGHDPESVDNIDHLHESGINGSTEQPESRDGRVAMLPGEPHVHPGGHDEPEGQQHGIDNPIDKGGQGSPRQTRNPVIQTPNQDSNLPEVEPTTTTPKLIILPTPAQLEPEERNTSTELLEPQSSVSHPTTEHDRTEPNHESAGHIGGQGESRINGNRGSEERLVTAGEGRIEFVTEVPEIHGQNEINSSVAKEAGEEITNLPSSVSPSSHVFQSERLEKFLSTSETTPLTSELRFYQTREYTQTNSGIFPSSRYSDIDSSHAKVRIIFPHTLQSSDLNTNTDYTDIASLMTESSVIKSSVTESFLTESSNFQSNSVPCISSNLQTSVSMDSVASSRPTQQMVHSDSIERATPSLSVTPSVTLPEASSTARQPGISVSRSYSLTTVGDAALSPGFVDGSSAGTIVAMQSRQSIDQPMETTRSYMVYTESSLTSVTTSSVSPTPSSSEGFYSTTTRSLLAVPTPLLESSRGTEGISKSLTPVTVAMQSTQALVSVSVSASNQSTKKKEEQNSTTYASTTLTTRKKPGSGKDTEKPENQSTSTSSSVGSTTTTTTTTTRTSTTTRSTSPRTFVTALISLVPAISPQKPVLTTPPSVYIEIKLRMDRSQFCTSKSHFISEIKGIIQTEKGTNVEEEQFKMNREICGGANSQMDGDIKSITIEMYIVDNDGKLDIVLTQVTSYVISKRFQDSNYLKDRIVYVHTVGRTQSELLPDPRPERRPAPPAVTMVIVIASVGGVCCVALIILQVLIHRRVKEKRKKRAFVGHRASLQSMDHVALGVIPKSRPNSGYWNPALDNTMEELEPDEHSHILNFSALANFCMDSKCIYAEFQTIPFDDVEVTSVPVGEEDKNRFANVLPHKHSRVNLKTTQENKSGYINANHINGYMGEKKVYIATQSPLVNTVEDFWRMVWEQQSRTILMLNPATQHGKPKQSTCYWPDNIETDCRREFGDYVVTLKKRDVQRDYIDCTLEIMDIERNLKREIHHFWFTCWSDTGPPEPLTLVKFVLDTRPHFENSGSPVVLHCGPGTGRTGVYIAVDMCMRMFEDRRRVDILSCVHRMRGERAGAVQTKEQYNLIYQALNEYAVILSSPSISTRSSVITLHAML